MTFTINCPDDMSVNSIIEAVIRKQVEKELAQVNIKQAIKDMVAEHQYELVEKAIETLVRSIRARMVRDKAYKEAQEEYMG